MLLLFLFYPVMHSIETGEEKEGQKSPVTERWGKSKLID